MIETQTVSLAFPVVYLLFKSKCVQISPISPLCYETLHSFLLISHSKCFLTLRAKSLI